MGILYKFQKLIHGEMKRWLFVIMVVALTHLLFQSFLLPYGNALKSLLPDGKASPHDKSSFEIHSSLKSAVIRNPLRVGSLDLRSDGLWDGGMKEKIFASEGMVQDDSEDIVDRDADDDISVEKEEGPDNISASDIGQNKRNGSALELIGGSRRGFPLEQVVKPGLRISDGTDLESERSQEPKAFELVNSASRSPGSSKPILSLHHNVTNFGNSASNKSNSVYPTTLRSNHVGLKRNSTGMIKAVTKKMRCEMPPKSVTTIEEMNRILAQRRRFSRAMRLRWSSVRDGEIFSARSHIENAPMSSNDEELYAPLFRNVSMFKKSFELMERTLKVYVYRDGSRPIFHTPILKGLYASEGWFMKLMVGNKRFVVRDPRKAHLYYMPFSSRMLEYTLYVRNSHNRTNLREYLRGYAEKIAAKYPYWNRTGGADHFLVACHDWAPYETRHHMEYCIKALCNADVTAGFKIGRDVSLPETYVRSARNPLRDLGGKPPSQRKILAFYAGNLHGYLRPILLKHWKDKYPDMRIYGPMPPGVSSKMNYIEHMKSSKYCICPKGYEVNSPRVVEAIFYECVPVIISDNFVPPFFDVLDWNAFSLILAEKDIPNLRDILLSIPGDKYQGMQLAVRKVQRHFLWHAKPERQEFTPLQNEGRSSVFSMNILRIRNAEKGKFLPIFKGVIQQNLLEGRLES